MTESQAILWGKGGDFQASPPAIPACGKTPRVYRCVSWAKSPEGTASLPVGFLTPRPRRFHRRRAQKAAPLPPTPWNQSRRFPPLKTAGSPLRYGGLQGGLHRPVSRVSPCLPRAWKKNTPRTPDSGLRFSSFLLLPTLGPSRPYPQPTDLRSARGIAARRTEGISQKKRFEGERARFPVPEVGESEPEIREDFPRRGKSASSGGMSPSPEKAIPTVICECLRTGPACIAKTSGASGYMSSFSFSNSSTSSGLGNSSSKVLATS